MYSYHIKLLFFILALSIGGMALFGYFAITGKGEALQKESSDRSLLMGLLLGQDPNMPPPLRTRDLSTYPEDDSPWGTRFPAAPDAPEGKFLAYYFDSVAGISSNIKPRIVDSIDINFGWAYDPATGRDSDYTSAPGVISSENFGAYWRGTFTLTEEQEVDVIVDSSWSMVQVIIDGKVVHSSAANTSGGNSTVRIPAGDHSVEVKFENGWHTTGMSVSLRPKLDQEAMRRIENKLATGNLQRWQVDVYESGNIDNSVKLTVTLGSYDPVTLHLNSYSAVRWDMASIPTGLVQTVVVSSVSGGARPINIPEGTEVLYRTEWIGSNSYEGSNVPGNVSQYTASSIVLPGGGAN